MAADWFLPLDEVGLRCLTEANGVNVSYPRRSLGQFLRENNIGNGDRFLVVIGP